MTLKPNQILLVSKDLLSGPGSFTDLEKYATKVTILFDHKNQNLHDIVNNLTSFQLVFDYRSHGPVLVLHFLLPRNSAYLNQLSKVVKKLQLSLLFENGLGKLQRLKFVLVDFKPLVDDTLTHAITTLQGQTSAGTRLIPVSLKFLTPCHILTENYIQEVEDTPEWIFTVSNLGDIPITRSQKLKPLSNAFTNYKKEQLKFQTVLQKVVSEIVYSYTEPVNDLEAKVYNALKTPLGQYPANFQSLARDRTIIDPVVIHCGFKSFYIGLLSELISKKDRDIGLHSLRFFKSVLHPKFLPKLSNQVLIPYYDKVSLQEESSYIDILTPVLHCTDRKFRFTADSIMPSFEVTVKPDTILKYVFAPYYSYFSKILSNLKTFAKKFFKTNLENLKDNQVKFETLTWQKRLQRNWQLLVNDFFAFSYAFTIEGIFSLPLLLEDIPIYRNTLVYEYDEKKGNYVKYAHGLIVGMYTTFTKTSNQAKLPLFVGVTTLQVKSITTLEKSHMNELPIGFPIQSLESLAKSAQLNQGDTLY